MLVHSINPSFEYARPSSLIWKLTSKISCLVLTRAFSVLQTGMPDGHQNKQHNYQNKQHYYQNKQHNLNFKLCTLVLSPPGHHLQDNAAGVPIIKPETCYRFHKVIQGSRAFLCYLTH